MHKTGWNVLILGAVFLLLVLLVPSSSPVAIGEALSLGPFRITAYGICIAIGALAALMAVVFSGLRKKLTLPVLMRSFFWAVLGAVLGARILYCLAMIESIAVDFGLLFIPQLWKGGYTLFGGVAGGLAAVWLYARKTKQPAGILLDSMAIGAAVFLMIIRLAEHFTTQGLGFFVDNPAWQWFPVAVQDAYGYWAAPVYVYEAFAALVIAVLCAVKLFRKSPGTAAVWFLALVSLTQILLDSWRQDEYIRFGFVHLNQLAAVAVLTVLIVQSVVRRVKQTGWNAWQGIRSFAFVVLVGVLIWIEFALDKSNIDNVILYAVMIAALIGMGIVVLTENKRDSNA